MRFTKLFVSSLLLIMVMISSCQKDESVKDMDTVKPQISSAIDSASTLSVSNNPDNFLAGKGTLKITIKDSTYTFDAATDSIAFINVHSGDSKYFGITAINKAHTMSFGISSIGLASANTTSRIAGGQFLFKADDKKPVLQYTLTQFVGQDDSGKISIEKYNNENIIAKGTFFTFLAKDDKVNSPFYRVEGDFELQLK